MKRCWPCLLALCFLWSCAPAELPPPLRVGINPWPGYEFVHLAEVKGFFREEGVNVQVLQFGSLNDNRRAYERGQIDGMGCTLIELLLATQVSARQPKAVYVPDFSNGGDVIIARRDVTDMTGLRGRRVAIEPGTLNLYLLARALQRQTLTLKDVQVVPLAQTDMLLAFERNEIDALVTYPPVSVAALKRDDAHAVFSSRDVPGEVLDVLAFDSRVLAERPDDVRRFLKAFDRAVLYADAQPDEAYAIMARREQIAVEDFRAAVTEDLHILAAAEQKAFFEPGGKLFPVLTETQNLLLEIGEIQKHLDLQALVEPQFALSKP